MKDLIITTISQNYKWEEIRNWACSLKRTGYDGDILILAYNFDNPNHNHIRMLQLLGIENILIPRIDMHGNEIGTNFVWHSGMVNMQNAHSLVHNVRLFHLWQYLKECQTQYRYVINTDSRDVVFQTNPTDWLTKNCKKPILVPSEGIAYANQPWNKDNLIKNFGMYVYVYALQNEEVCNVGTFACNGKLMGDLCLTMYLMSIGVGHCDQPSFNILTRGLLKDDCQVVDFKGSWALQIGAKINQIPDISYIKDNIIYCKNNDEPYCIVHQYDRVEELNRMINQKYEQ
jgi:hypothetical protein